MTTIGGASKVALVGAKVDNGLVRGGWVYIVTNRPNGTLYVGLTSDLARRLWEHREGVGDGFTKKVWPEAACLGRAPRRNRPRRSSASTT
ncbi:MAG TPA: GIY-YIG nuclease family protein [Stellaceae bacterium]|nr:GIY-YIG nuclease family protein [Stellaceae bacterium]